MKTEIATSSFLRVLTGHRQWVSVKAACDRLKNAGFDAVLAGGCVRDGLLGVQPSDFDVATDATPDQVEGLFEKSISIGKTFGVIAIPIENGEVIEIATFRKDGTYADGRHPMKIEFADRAEDAKRRDFTVNALFYDPSSNEIFDEVEGLKDLEAKCLRVVGEPEKRFAEDKLRLLRAVRFAGQLNFQIEPSTAAAVQSLAKNLNVVSRERVRDEIDKLLIAASASYGFKELDRLKLARPVFEDWSPWIFPIRPHVFSESAVRHSLEIRRALLYFPAFKQTSPDRILDRLRNWKYGRSFCDLIAWLIKNEAALRLQVPDLVRSLKSRDEIIENFRVGVSEDRTLSLGDRSLMDALELWTDDRAVRATQILDLHYGEDEVRSAVLKKRGLVLGQADPLRAKAADLLAHRDGRALEGAVLGRELRRLNREILRR